MKYDLNKIRDLMHRLGIAIGIAVGDLEDEGDRVYFGSTNDADTLREARRLYDDYRIETGDLGEDVSA